MDPFTLCLIFSAIIVKLIKVDAQRAQRGETPPGYRLIEKWLEGRKARGQAPANAKPAKYGMWRYFFQRWRALWELAGQSHELAHQARLKERAEASARGQLPPARTKRPSLKEQTGAAWQWVLDNVIEPRGEKPAPADKTPAPAVAQPEPIAGPGAPVIACDECGAVLIDLLSGGHQHPAGSTCSKAWVQPEPEPAEDPAIPNRATEGDDMTAVQQSGEVTGIPSAIHYLEQMARTHTAHADEGHVLVARLGDMNVGTGDISQVLAAVEKSQNAAELHTAAADSIRRNNAAVREGFASSPEAADKHAHQAD
jgi:hypothetical protein